MIRKYKDFKFSESESKIPRGVYFKLFMHGQQEPINFVDAIKLLDNSEKVEYFSFRDGGINHLFETEDTSFLFIKSKTTGLFFPVVGIKEENRE